MLDRMSLCVGVGLDSRVGLAVLALGLLLPPEYAVDDAADDEDKDDPDDDKQTHSHPKNTGFWFFLLDFLNKMKICK